MASLSSTTNGTNKNSSMNHPPVNNIIMANTNSNNNSNKREEPPQQQQQQQQPRLNSTGGGPSNSLFYQHLPSATSVACNSPNMTMQNMTNFSVGTLTSHSVNRPDEKQPVSALTQTPAATTNTTTTTTAKANKENTAFATTTKDDPSNNDLHHAQNLTIHVTDDQSYDYYMEAHGTASCFRGGSVAGTTIANDLIIPASPSNGTGNDTFEDLWLLDTTTLTMMNDDYDDECGGGAGAGAAVGTGANLMDDDDSDNQTHGTNMTGADESASLTDDRVMIQRMIWKANAATAMAAAFQKQKEKQEEPQNTTAPSTTSTTAKDAVGQVFRPSNDISKQMAQLVRTPLARTPSNATADSATNHKKASDDNSWFSPPSAPPFNNSSSNQNNNNNNKMENTHVNKRDSLIALNPSLPDPAAQDNDSCATNSVSVVNRVQLSPSRIMTEDALSPIKRSTHHEHPQEQLQTPPSQVSLIVKQLHQQQQQQQRHTTTAESSESNKPKSTLASSGSFESLRPSPSPVTASQSNKRTTTTTATTTINRNSRPPLPSRENSSNNKSPTTTTTTTTSPPSSSSSLIAAENSKIAPASLDASNPANTTEKTAQQHQERQQNQQSTTTTSNSRALIVRSKSSPPDPPSHLKPPPLSSQQRQQLMVYHPSTTKASQSYKQQQQQKLLHQQQQKQKQKQRPRLQVPQAVPGGSYYDPEEEEDALTNLVITVVGLEDGKRGDVDGDDNTIEGEDGEEDPRAVVIHPGQEGGRGVSPPSLTEGDGDDDDDEEEPENFQDEPQDDEHHRVHTRAREYRNSPRQALPWTATTATTRSSVHVDVGAPNQDSSFQSLFWTVDPTSAIFFSALLLLWVPVIIFVVLVWDLINLSGDTAADMTMLSFLTNRNDEWQIVFQIPMNEDVTIPVRTAQVCILLGWVLLVKQTALIDTTVQLLCGVVSCLACRQDNKKHSPVLSSTTPRSNTNSPDRGDSYSKMSLIPPRAATFPPLEDGFISKGRWFIGTIMEWLKHLLYMVNAVLLLAQATDSVMMLLWNMSAIEFISRLDSCAYQIWIMGKWKHLFWRGENTYQDEEKISFLPVSNSLPTPSTVVETGAQGSVPNNSSNHYSSSYNLPSPNSNTPSPAATNSATFSSKIIHGIKPQYFVFPKRRTHHPKLRILLYCMVSCAILVAFGAIVSEQVLGYPAMLSCDALMVQFGDTVHVQGNVFSGRTNDINFVASFFSGIYLRRQGKFIRHHGRYIYDLHVPSFPTSGSTLQNPTFAVATTGRYKLAYCRPIQAWTLSRDILDPCFQYLLRTNPTKSYDLLSLKSESLIASKESTTWFLASRERGTSDTFHDAPLDWFHIACADCASNRNAGSENSFGYPCVHANSQMAFAEQVSGKSMPTQSNSCRNLTVDTRTSPFPDTVWNIHYEGAGDESATIVGGVDPRATFDVLLDSTGSILLEPQFQHPVYASHFESQLVLMVFVGRRWVIVLLDNSIDHWLSHPERHLDSLLTLWAHWQNQWAGGDSVTSTHPLAHGKTALPLFVSDAVDLSAQQSEDRNMLTPVGLKWNTIDRDDSSASFLSLKFGSPLETTLLCSTCNNVVNPCHSGGICYNDDPVGIDGAHCICRPGFRGSLCESSSYGCKKGDALGECFNGGSCDDELSCQCPLWERNGKAHQVRGDLCQYLPNCWEYEIDGVDCFERGSCSNAGCDNGGACQLDGTCKCDSLSGAEGKLCQEKINCWDYEEDGKGCVEKRTCKNAACNGGTCASDGSCKKCPELSRGRFCHLVDDCFASEIGGASSDCFETGRCTNAGCANEGLCQRDGSCLCPSPDEAKSNNVTVDDDDTLIAAPESNNSPVWFSGKLCQIQHGDLDLDEVRVANESSTPSSQVPCEMSACVLNGGTCTSDGVCECPHGLTGQECETPLDCFEGEVGGKDCVELGICTNKACHIRSDNSTCLANGECKCPEMYEVEIYGKLCHKVWPIDDCFEAEADGRDCFKKGTCSNVGCSNGGKCTEDGSCDCSSLFWGKTCQHARDCFEQEYSCFFNMFITGGANSNQNNHSQSNAACSDAGCLSNGICQASGHCLCPDGFSGKICEESLT